MAYVELTPLQKNSLPAKTTSLLAAGGSSVDVDDQSVFYRDSVLLTKGWVLGPDNSTESYTEEIEVSATAGTSGAGAVTISARAVKADGTNGVAREWPIDTTIKNTYTTSIHDQIRDNFADPDHPAPTLLPVTASSKGGVFNGGFELGTKDTAVTTSGVIGVNSGWYLSEDAGQMSAELDTAVALYGTSSLKLEAVDTSGAGVVYNTSGVTLPILSLEGIPLKASTKYRLTFWAKTNLVGADGVYATLDQYDSAAVAGTTATTNKLSTTNDFTVITVSFTSDNDAAFGRIGLHNSVAGAVNQTWFDSSGFPLVEIVEDTTNTSAIPTPLLTTITGVTSTDNIDVNNWTGDTNAGMETTWCLGQQFTTTKNKITKVGVNLSLTGDISANPNITVSITSDSGNKPTTTILASKVVDVHAISTSPTELVVELPCLLTPSTLYWVTITGVAAWDGSNKISWRYIASGSLYQGYSTDGTNWTAATGTTMDTRVYYAKPTDGATIICNGEKLSLSADSDGILSGAIIDLDKGKYVYDSGDFVATTTALTFANGVYSAVAGGETIIPVMINGYGCGAGSFYQLTGGSDGSFIVKINTLLPIKHLKVKYGTYADPNNQTRCDISADGVNFSSFISSKAAGAEVSLYGETDLVNGLSTFYLKFISETGKFLVVGRINYGGVKIEADLDTASLPQPLIYPLATNQFAEEVVLPTAATRIYYRTAKFANDRGVVVPHLEFTDGSGNYIKAIPCKIDNTGETNPAIDIIVADTTNGQQVGTGSADATTGYILNDGEYMTLSSSASVVKVTYKIGGGTTTFANITKNRWYISSNGSANDATKDPSLQVTVTNWWRVQSVVRAVHDLTRKVSDIARSTIKFNASYVADGGTVFHGLGRIPGVVVVTPMVAAQMVSVTAKDALTFTVAIKTDAGAAGTTQTIYWIAI